MDPVSQIYINTEAAARLLGLSTSTLAKWRLSGIGPTFAKLGRRVVYRRIDIDEWLEGNRFRSTSEYVRSFPGAFS